MAAVSVLDMPLTSSSPVTFSWAWGTEGGGQTWYYYKGLLALSLHASEKMAKGRIYKTKEYEWFKDIVQKHLPPIQYQGPIEIFLRLGFKHRGMVRDLDNCSKPLLDILQKKIILDDNQVFDAHWKKDVKAVEDYVYIEIKPYREEGLPITRILDLTTNNFIPF